MEITVKDVRIFLFGMLFMLLIVLAYDWTDFKRGLSGQAQRNSQSNSQPTETR